MKARVLKMGLSTLLGWRRQGYFIPYRYADQVEAGGAGYPAIERLLGRHRPEFERLLESLAVFAPQLQALSGASPPDPRWQQSWFPRLDGAVAYGLTRLLKPARIIEVGSGHSSRFFYRALRDGGLDCRLTAIDPAPRADLEQLPIELLRRPLQRCDLSLFDTLESGDILFVDSSHLLLPGSDVDWLLNRVWPALAEGVLVHFHDILLPDDYPATWRWRGYNEQQGVAPLLGGAAEPLWASHYVVTRMGDALSRSPLAALPMPDEAIETSLWLRKTTPAV
ncbi:hypothetical protein GCM10011348_06230 [Marinobacterium nitratireducens]|uniref:Class I SAM-dependent methyltransferase n=1 Tax=Marinobacterium nitratireducens TaxID=518897 RepID=A0A917Z7Y5_9GAMM|nr:class I SAM-dependent methyltransferase [Marinobacterium nitratireducens]GGO77218.1 hypothetical protein GCM10011348_06230 [Marinobacterium nitratireducens]